MPLGRSRLLNTASFIDNSLAMKSEATFYRQSGKRLIDLCIAIPLFIAAFPVMLTAGFFVLTTSGRPVFFLQARLAQGGRTFWIIKFRTMTVARRTIDGEVFENHPDVTWIGKILRRTKIDESPQLWNILRGDLSLIGPRPLPPESVDRFNHVGAKRLDVPQGLACLTEVNGNIYLDWDDRWCYDAEYVDRQSFWLDIKIFFCAILVVIFGEKKFLKPYEGKYKSIQHQLSEPYVA